MSHTVVDSVGIIGDGAMGTLAACILAEGGYRVTLWSAFADHAATMQRERENRRFLPGLKLPESVSVTSDARQLPREAQFLVSAVPTPYLREVFGRIASDLPAAPIVSVTKGIEVRSLKRPSQVLHELLGEERPVAVLSGPCIANEIAARKPATVVVAGQDEHLCRRVQEAMSREYFRVYRNSDPVGVELAGALKNVIAIAAGMCDGLKLGDNAKAALLTRGLAEISRLGRELRADTATFSGLAGMGDLVTTCISPHGRNRTVGEAIGSGRSLQEVLSGMHQVAEGVHTTRSAVALAERAGVEMPICRQVYNILFENKEPRIAIRDLMTRPWRSEEEPLD